jgi:phosphoribosylformylglycinamidine synthase subunit PurQ / glutaminase
MATIKALIMRAPGTNCDEETAFAFERAGSATELVHINQLVAGARRLPDYQILAFPGGFSYGDDLGAGKVQANELIARLCQEVIPFIDKGGLILGICNGFQVLVKAGILPGPVTGGQTVTLTNNNSGRFECRWVYLAGNPRSQCIFTRGVARMYLPVAHGEGKLVAPPEILDQLDVALYYADAEGEPCSVYPACPNGSMRAIAGLTDATGRIFALMPHPERYISPTQHPRWPGEGPGQVGDGLKIFQNAVAWAKRV